MTTCGIHWGNRLTSKEDWFSTNKRLLINLKHRKTEEYINLARSSQSRIYKYLDFSKGITYCNENFSPSQIMWIIKARSDMLWLNGSRFNETGSRLCSLCNLNEEESTIHFLGRCPILKEIRLACLAKTFLNENETIAVLNGYKEWKNLAVYIEKAIFYRKFLVDEFNF